MPATLPTGTVTFLFTDVEGSTSLLHALGAPRYAQALGEHRRIVRDAFATHGGVEVDTQGDAFFVAFPTPQGAVHAAVQALIALAGGPMQVRMGIHTGTPHLTGEGYTGSDVHRGARIAAAAYGGQIVMSEATRSLVHDALPAGVTARDLGVHRFKDFAETERIHQLVVDGQRADFPPLKSLDRAPSNLPLQLTTFIGRVRIDEVLLRLRDGARLLTLTGPGGTGKTRLSIEVAGELIASFPGGVYWIPIAAITDVALVGPAIAASLGLHDSGIRPVLERVADHLKDKTALLVIDNLEQLLPSAAPVIGDLLRAAPNVKIIASSRAPLRISGEQEFPVRALASVEAVSLFVERAIAVKPDFQITAANAGTIAEICARLDGLPLAIELATARVKMLPPDAILSRLGRALDLLYAGSRDMPDRQRTLRGTISWSYDLLDPPTRALFARIAVFAGGASLPEIEAICGSDILDELTALVDQSLLNQSEMAGEPRFLMLATIREYAIERLDGTDEAAAIRRRHAEAFLDLATRVQADLTGERQPELLDRLERDHDNIRAATEWAIVHDGGLAMRFVGSMWRFWHMRGHLNEAEAIAARVLALPKDGLARERLRALDGAGGVAYWQGDMLRARGRYQEALDIATALGDDAQIAEQTYNLSFTYQIGPSDIPTALALAERALAAYRELDDRPGIAKVLSGYAYGLYQLDDRARARPVIEECIALMRELNDQFGLAWALEADGLIKMKDGQLDDARPSIAESLRIFAQAGDLTGVMLLLMDSAVLAVLGGDLARGVRLFAACEKLRDESGATLANTIDARQLPGIDLVRDATERLDVAREEGHHLSRDDAIALALS